MTSFIVLLIGFLLCFGSLIHELFFTRKCDCKDAAVFLGGAIIGALSLGYTFYPVLNN